MKPFLNPALWKKLLEACELTEQAEVIGILEATQKRWLIDKQSLPYEGITYPLAAGEHIYELAARLGYIEQRKPLKSYYKYGVLLGGETSTMEPRFVYLNELWQKGLAFEKLVFHGGVHPMPSTDPHVGCTETQAMQLFHRKFGLADKFPTSGHVFIDIPLQVHMKHPTTQDGVLQWLSTNPEPGNCLVISSQPYIHYQHAVFLSCMPANFSIETVGPAAEAHVPLSIILDSITRHLYQEKALQ